MDLKPHVVQPVFQDKVISLNAKLKILQKTQKFSSRQLELMHKTMLDTIVHFQYKLENYSIHAEKSEQMQKFLQENIKQLEKTTAELEEKLFIALGNKFAYQQSTFDSISKGINNYISRIKDLSHSRREVLPALLLHQPRSHPFHVSG